jgi:hypothetical protein
MGHEQVQDPKSVSLIKTRDTKVGSHGKSFVGLLGFASQAGELRRQWRATVRGFGRVDSANQLCAYRSGRTVVIYVVSAMIGVIVIVGSSLVKSDDNIASGGNSS